ncbi:hypothetical protein FHR24_001809 [Wenyingzhuangia heitensis]|uniref:Starch-binding associating with outer membrane n=1 Tax=Wenyingzhuangia heitensis TaxID=1487859 RepID=A0ABX0UCZ3_9FLAO|nr:RagB/SusD family nutrient uptake outer membrane protein [Wenyingzhuangia heitensis]NIJ45341.1 hypothetical protein [Wenyingzhuangia heitensis]
MKHIKINNIFIFFLFFSLLSCSDESLTELNPNSPVVSWESLKDTQKGLNSIYNSLLDESLLSIKNEAIRSDMGYPGYGRPVPDRIDAQVIYNQSYNSGTPYISAKWDAHYTTIYYANQVINGLNIIKPTLEETEIEDWESQMAQARFFRGLMHFYLHSLYNNGRIIIRDEIPNVETGFGKGLSSSEEVKAFFREDLMYAYEKLPESYPDNYLGSATKWAVATFLGKSHLYAEEYAQAKVYFNDVINNGGYELVEDTSLLFKTPGGEFNKESIFELAYNTEHRNDFTVWEAGKMSNQLSHESTANTGFYPPAWIVNEYKNEELDLADSRNFFTEVNPDGTTKDVLRPISLRASTMVAIVNDELSDYGTGKTKTPDAIKINNNGWGFGYYKKYLDFSNTDSRGSRSRGSNVIVLRLADVHLMLAECLIQEDDLEGALENINAVRYRWALQLLGKPNPKWPDSTFESDKDTDGNTDADYVEYTKETLMNRLMYVERPLELSVEGNADRWIDLRRWGKLKENYEKLSGEVFYLTSYTYDAHDKDTGFLTGSTTTKNNSEIVDVDPGATGLNIIDYEYDEAFINYNATLHDYYPIPLNEILRNPELN